MFRKLFNTFMVGMVFPILLWSTVAWGGNQEDKVTNYRGWSIPSYVKPEPNLATLEHYFLKDYNLLKDREIGHYRVKPLGNHTEFQKEIEKNKFLTKQMETSSILSYLFYEDGKIRYDEITPKERLGNVFSDSTHNLSNSVGKSFVSYLVGHAICNGHISDINSRVDDWPLIEKTLYHGQKLIDLLNMNAGDARYVHDVDGMVETERWPNSHSIKSIAERELNNSKPIAKTSRKHHYNGLLTNVIINYVAHKSGYQIQELLEQVFQQKVKTEYQVMMRKQLFERTDNGNMTSKQVLVEHGTAQYTFYLTRYDYLRLATSMLHDWKSNNCVGKYLKQLAANKIPQKRFLEKDKGYGRFSAKSYAGQFHMDYLGLEDRNIFGMNGYGG